MVKEPRSFHAVFQLPPECLAYYDTHSSLPHHSFLFSRIRNCAGASFSSYRYQISTSAPHPSFDSTNRLVTNTSTALHQDPSTRIKRTVDECIDVLPLRHQHNAPPLIHHDIHYSPNCHRIISMIDGEVPHYSLDRRTLSLLVPPFHGFLCVVQKVRDGTWKDTPFRSSA